MRMEAMILKSLSHYGEILEPLGLWSSDPGTRRVNPSEVSLWSMPYGPG
jgi:hypothetical protein